MMRYRIILEKNELGGYTVTVPALPPVVTQGDTIQEAMENAKEAILLYIEYLKDKGESIPEDSEMVIADVMV